MDQPKSDTDPSHDSPPGEPRMDDRTDSPPPSNGPSLKWAFTSKPALVVLLAFAGWGAWSLTYQILLLNDSALWFLVALSCVVLVVTHRYWRPPLDRVVQRANGSQRTEPQETRMDWKTFVAMGIVIMAMRAGEQSMQPKRPFVRPRPDSPVSPHLRGRIANPDSVDFAVQKRQATAMYWQTAVANFHAVRFETPSGQESFEKYQERMFQQLRSLTDTAKSAPTGYVDADLVQMATRHLAVEDQCLELKSEMDKLVKRQQIPSPTDTVDQRMELTHAILNLLEADPQAIEKLPPGPERDLVEKCFALEQTRQEQFREIEIMQATLQERYKGIAFPLPTINQ